MTAAGERQIRELLEARTRALGRRDATTAATGYDDDLVLYDGLPPQAGRRLDDRSRARVGARRRRHRPRRASR
ncbi:hypothetical protein Psuf_054470 [Phytohabitans suffuscus]|uniref:Uncharacterized protein n=1 Tax=Phytohabitans suffuscus TaxID=624315 RepID=A0A6F8YPY3_9ACTN|nr:hypothetical protein [Phytohabitans suffuscus]BCB88134.1 hypothetical protein Psuf_054470 [Phytohabitans suffuscus]